MLISNKDIQRRLRDVYEKTLKAQMAGYEALSEQTASTNKSAGTLPKDNGSFLSRAIHDIGHAGKTVGKTLFQDTAKLANETGELAADTIDLGKATVGKISGNKVAERNALEAAARGHFVNKGQGLFGTGGFISSQEASKPISAGKLAKTIVAGGTGTAAEILPFLYGAGEVNAARELSTAGKFARAGKAAVAAGGLGGASSLADQALEGHISPKQTAEDIGLSSALGLIGYGGGRVVNRLVRGKGAKGAEEIANTADNTIPEPITNSELEGARAVHPTESKLPTQGNPEVKSAVDAELNNVQRAAVVPEANGTVRNTSPVNTLVDYFRTPTKVLRKVGLHDVANTVEKSFENYRKQRSISDTIIKDWARSLPEKDSQLKVFRFLNGDKSQKLTAQEAEVASEMRGFLNDYADKLGIPEDKRVTDYITHIFEPDLKGKSIDPTLAQIYDSKATSDVFNPFTQKRIGKGGFKEDLFGALDAYSKKADRSIFMKPALEATADASKNVDQRTAKYLLSLNRNLAMKPDKVDQIINDVAASVTGDRFAPNLGTRALKGWRNTIYRATLGLNVGSAVRNLTQGANTFAELGTRDTLAGYSQVMRSFAQAAEERAAGKPVAAFDELRSAGVLDDAIHRQDVNTKAIKGFLQKADTGLWSLFDTAEKINRGAAYFGAKNKALRAGKTLEEAMDIGRQAVEKTQFKFNDIETPLALRNQVVKTLGQFQSFNLKQAEFLGGIGKGASKDIGKILTGQQGLKGLSDTELAKAVRWVGANLVLAETLGSLIGMKWTDALPSFLSFRGVSSPTAQLVGDVKNIVQGKNQYGGDEPRGDAAKSALSDATGLLIPGGTQGKKTYQGLEATNRGFSETNAGRVRFPVSQSPEEKLRAGIFGQYATPEAQQFYAQGAGNLSEAQSKKFIEASPELKPQYYDFYHTSQGITSLKTKTNKEITQLIRNGEINKAQRLASQYNNTVDEQLQPFFDHYKNPQKDIIDDANKFKIIITHERQTRDLNKKD